MSTGTIQVNCDGNVRHITLTRPQADNAINGAMVEELNSALTKCPQSVLAVVLEGSSSVFCAGADFNQNESSSNCSGQTPELFYDTLRVLAEGPFVSLAHIRGKANAGGVGLAAACDVTLADTTASFGLSELLFGIFPACIMPYLVRRIGRQRAHYMTLTSRTVTAQTAQQWGLVDEINDDSARLLRIHLQRLCRLRRSAIATYKVFAKDLGEDALGRARPASTNASRRMFSDPAVVADISRFVQTGQFPWLESE